MKITHHIYGDESGDFTTQPVFVLGIVKTSRPDYHESMSENICQLYGVDREIKYSSTDNRTVPIREAFIDFFLGQAELEFRCIVKARATHSIHQYRGNHLGIPPQDLAYNRTYFELISNNVLPNERVLVFTDDKSRAKNDNLFEYLRDRIPQVADAQPRDSKKSRLLQLSDLLTGCVFGNLTGVTHPGKVRVQQHLLQKLQVQDFENGIAGTKFNVWHW